jgi:hypothetical protein
VYESDEGEESFDGNFFFFFLEGAKEKKKKKERRKKGKLFSQVIGVPPFFTR